jgi:plasmid stabilization system protein ParE
LTASLAIRVSARAAAQIEQAAAWWEENRPSAPGAIRSDVAEILVILAVQPGIGAPARRGRAQGIRRASLSRIHYNLYYRVSSGAIEVLAFWHMSRGRQPYA